MPEATSSRRVKAGPGPYPVRFNVQNEVSTDVLVLGGGLAGCFAAIAAARKGVKVAIVEKAATVRSGCAGGGIDHFQECVVPGVTKVSAAELAKARNSNHDGYSMEELDYVSATEAWERLLDLEKLGVKIRDTDDEYKGSISRDEESKLLFAHDPVAKHTVTFWGAGEPGKAKQGMKPALYNECKRLGIEICDRVMATSLLTEGGKQGARVVGATGVNRRTGEFHVFKSKATIITTGWVTRLWFYAGNTWCTGFGYEGSGVNTNTGDGMAMAFRVGAELMNMESSMPSPSAFGYRSEPIPGVSGLDDRRGDSAWPARVIDATGKPVPTTFPPYRSPRYQLGVGSVPCFLAPGGLNKHDGEALRTLIREGKVVPPLYLDTPSLTDIERKRIFEVNERNEGGWVRWWARIKGARKGIDPAKDRKEVQNPYTQRYGREMKWGNAGGGVSINVDAETSLKGLYAAGDLAPGGGLASGSAVFGWRAGNNAADYAGKAAEPAVDAKQVEDEKTRVYAPVQRKAGITWKELNLAVKYIMTTYCNEVKNEPVLKAGLEAFQEVKEEEAPRLHAKNPHELMHALETLNLITIGEAILHASLARKASSESLGFFRIDYPEMDPPEWRKWVTVKMENGQVKTGTKEIRHI